MEPCFIGPMSAKQHFKGSHTPRSSHCSNLKLVGSASKSAELNKLNFVFKADGFEIAYLKWIETEIQECCIRKSVERQLGVPAACDSFST